MNPLFLTETATQDLVTINWTFIAQICNLFIQMFLIKKFLFKPVREILAKRQAKADADISRSGKENTMKAKLVGVQGIHFTNNSGEEVNGTKIYCAFQDENVEGLRTADFFLKDGITLPKDTKLNDAIDISFNMKGKVEMIFKA